MEPYFQEHPDLDTFIGHSAGASATLESERHFPEKTPRTYNAPVLAKYSYDSSNDENKKR